MKTLIVIPAYNEEANIVKTVGKIDQYNATHEYKFDYIVINDCSKDNTPVLLDEHHIPHIDLVHNLGIGGAVQTGYKYGYEHGYDIAVQCDGDGQHDVNYVMDIITPIMNDEADLVIGSRFIEGKKSEFQTTAARRMGIKLISFFIKLKTGTTVLDTTSGFRAINRDILKLFSTTYPTEYPEPISTTWALLSKKRFLEVPVEMNEREGGVSSIRAWKNVYYMLNVIFNILIAK